MVKPAPVPFRPGPLDRKVVRDLRRMLGQAVAIGAIIALGVLVLVMMDGLVNSLVETKRAYYERYRLADVFAPLQRAPRQVLVDLAQIPGVATVEGRVKGGALIDLPGLAVPVRALAISLPDFGPPRLNDFFLVAGRPIDPAQPDEILLLKAFADAHGLNPGDRLTATLHGARRTLHIAGMAQSPEFLFSTPPGEMMPDDARFAVLWMNERTLAAAYDVDGACNEVLLSLTRDATLPAVLAAVDRLLEPYGGRGAYGIRDHLSDRFVQEEIEGLRASRKAVPPVFLAVAAFLLNIVISRLIQAEREQIGLLKAFGYSSLEVAAHYLKFILAIAIGGALVGCVSGVWAGRALISLYLVYYKFPFLVFEVDPRTFLIGFAVSVLGASLGGLWVLRQVFALAPAVAMRPPAPADFSRSARVLGALKRFLDQPTRIVVRRFVRQPGRSAASVLGIAAGMALSVAMLGVMAGFDEAVEHNFSVIDRSDATVTLFEPLSDKVIYELQRQDGVLVAEPFRLVPAVLRHGRRTYRGSVSGLVDAPQLNRALGADLQPIHLRDDGIILSQPLADRLRLQPGDRLTLEVREGRRPVIEVPVVGIAHTLLGAPAYMELGALNRALREPHRVSGAHLRVDPARGEPLYQRIKRMPAVAGVSLKSEARVAFQKVLDTGAGAIRYVMAAIAGVITFGIIYNSARIALAERARDLASLRVLGFTEGETAFVLLGELGVITLLALPAGGALGYFLAQAISAGFSSDLYQIPAYVAPAGYGTAAVAVLLAAGLSGWLVKRDLDRLDLITALKIRE